MTVRLRVLYCDDYYGYTLHSWIIEVRDILERELCDEVVVLDPVKKSGECREPVYLEADGEIVVEGLPGEEGYLLETLKSLLSRCNGSEG